MRFSTLKDILTDFPFGFSVSGIFILLFIVVSNAFTNLIIANKLHGITEYEQRQILLNIVYNIWSGTFTASLLALLIAPWEWHYKGYFKGNNRKEQRSSHG